MAILTIDIPDDLKKRCESIFVGQTIEEMLARLLQEALEQETVHRRAKAVDRLLARRAATKPVSAEEIQAARLAGRP
jgi:predicted transcriptional regulator